ncbi:ABC-type lipoprotein export system, ATPase component [Georgenia satyanarayanai]|uniref:ABC-type lipoprotein export system, ATPase component n=1 Tax=Georgenia satyanarayanai TaxID=860221 RepID=A0A2Y9APJ8_9MICO|nr:ABC transporter ATP-binding protein [Georgenia satyanarayanai]PYF96815.1 ABC-type lipoprotein export system ATPase subunit [Georgenia satyanarayanai]SSA46411.1 ABC-type lipoprotein export system, ATPase component [Georgenia satyanarayanai]
MTTTTEQAREPDILCHGLVRIFSTEGVEVQALQGLDLRVERGDVVAIVGASGSGKSTLLSILSGLDRPTGGSAVVAGTDIGTMSRADRVRYQRHTVGFVWQQTSRNLLPYLTAAENIAVPLVLSGAEARAERVDELLSLLGIEHCRDRRPEQMSGGEQQRTAIAVALANSPRVLLADEPTGELDDATSAEVLEALRGASERLGVTVLVVTHDPTVSEHVRRTVQIRDGRTATEVLRRTERDDSGAEVHVAEEFAVLDRTGRLQLPEEFVSALALRERVRLALETDHVGVWPDGAGRGPSVADGVADPGGNADVAGTADTMAGSAGPVGGAARSGRPRRRDLRGSGTDG